MTVACAAGADSVKFTAQPLAVSYGDKFRFHLTGYGQVHYELTRENDKTNNDFQVKRVILVGNLAFGKHLKASTMVDVAANRSDRRLQEAYLQWDFVPEAKIRVGQFKQPFMLENLYSPVILGDLNMTDGTRYMAGIGGDVLQGAMAGRDIGIMFTGDALPAADGHRYLGYSLGVFNGAGLNTRDNNSSKDVIGMLNVRPLKELMLTTSFILGRGHALADSPYGDVKEGENYTRNRWSIGVEAKWGRLSNLRSEFTIGRNGDINSRAFYAEAWLTIIPKLELVLNYDHLNRNTSLDKSGQEAYPFHTVSNNYTAGLQYWVWNRCRIASQYVYCDRKTGGDAHQWITQFQFAF